MVGIKRLQEHLVKIKHSSLKADIEFLDALGQELLDSDGENIDLTYMQYIKETINQLYKKYFPKNADVDEEVEKAWLKARGIAIALSKGELPPAEFYTEALSLGRKIKKLAQSIGTTILPLLQLSALMAAS